MDRASVQFQTKNSKPAAQGKSEALPLQTDLWNSQVEVFFSLPAFRQRQMGPAAQEQSQRPAQLLALALKYPNRMCVCVCFFLKDLDGLIRANIILDKRQ